MKSKKYNTINEDLINRIIDEEIIKFKNNKLCIKSVKNKLHQIHEAFLSSESNSKVKRLLEENKCDDILLLHTSTLERKPFYEKFYKNIFSVTGIPDSIIDIACGYNPFSIKYMNLSKDFRYYAYDINEETSNLLNDFFKVNNYNGVSKTIDLARNTPKDKCDIALVLKFLPLVEQQNNKYSLNLLQELNANYIIVSFPTKTLTGRNVGMLNNYTVRFKELIKKNFIILDEITFYNELVFIIRKE